MSELNAREMAAAPITGKNDKKNEKKQNRFVPIFGQSEPTFKAISGENKPLTFTDGTIQTRLASVALELGNSGAYVVASVVSRKKADTAPQIRLQWPSSGGQFRRPMIDTSNSEKAENELSEFGDLIIGKWKTWRKAQIANGTAATASETRRSGVSLTAEEAEELGLN